MDIFRNNQILQVENTPAPASLRYRTILGGAKRYSRPALFSWGGDPPDPPRSTPMATNAGVVLFVDKLLAIVRQLTDIPSAFYPYL